MVIILLANGFEELEALSPLDILMRAGYEVKTVGISGEYATGTHGITVKCDLSPDEVDLKSVDLAIFPGGMPGAENLDKSEFTDKVINELLPRGGRLAAICAAPLVFGRRGLLEGKCATCYPGFESELRGAKTISAPVVTDGNITTARSFEAAFEFGRELERVLAENVSNVEADTCNKDIDDTFTDAVELALKHGKISTSLIQRKLSLGYGKAAQIIDDMEELGIISKTDGFKPRDVLITQDEWSKMLSRIKK